MATKLTRTTGSLTLDEDLRRLYKQNADLANQISGLKSAPAFTQQIVQTPAPLPSIAPAVSVQAVGSANVVGVLPSYAREDHVHSGVTSFNGATGAVTYSGTVITPHANGLVPTTFNLDWNNGVNQSLLLPNSAVTLTLSNPVAGQVYTVEVLMGAVPGTITWPATVKWGSVSATLTVNANQADLIRFYYNGASYVALSHNTGYVP